MHEVESGRLPENGRYQESLDYLADTLWANTILLMRLYDVNMALLATTNPDAAQDLYRKHAAGRVVGPIPKYEPESLEDE